ncbi:Atp-binding protein, partial [Globisporangium splendens]
MCGFLVAGSPHGVFELMLFLTNMTFAAWFFFLAAISPDLHIAKPVSMISILFFVLFAGFIISKDQLPDYVIWIYWLNPIAWCLRSLAVNQYRGAEFDKCTYAGVDYCTKFNLTAGKYYLSLFDVPNEKEWRYALGNLIALAFGKCDSVGGSDLGCQQLQNAPVAMTAGMTVHEYVNEVFDANRDDIPRNFGILIAFIVFFRILALLSLRFVNHQKR